MKILLALLLMNSGQYFVVVVEAKSVNTLYLSLALLLLRVVYCREEFLPMNETGERRVFYRQRWDALPVIGRGGTLPYRESPGSDRGSGDVSTGIAPVHS